MRQGKRAWARAQAGARGEIGAAAPGIVLADSHASALSEEEEMGVGERGGAGGGPRERRGPGV